MILVTTAGKVGAATAALLAKADTPVRVLSRNSAKLSALSEAGVDIVAGDLDDPASIATALDGVSSVVLVSPAVPDQELAVVRCATEADVRHVVKVTSKASPDSPIIRQRGQAQIEAGLISSGLNYTLLRNNFYMQNFLITAPAIAATGSFGSSARDGKVGFVDTRDVAAVAAECATSPALHAGKTYLLSGPELLTYSDAAGTLTKVLGRRITFTPRTRGEDAETMVKAGVPRPIAEMNAHAVSLIAEGDAAWLSDDVAVVTGRGPRSFEHFVRDHAAVFS